MTFLTDEQTKLIERLNCTLIGVTNAQVIKLLSIIQKQNEVIQKAVEQRDYWQGLGADCLDIDYQAKDNQELQNIMAGKE